MTVEFQWLNYYECPACSYSWYDVWDCQVDMICDSCGCRDISPTDSYELAEGGLPKSKKCLWKASGESIFGTVYETQCENEISAGEIHADAVFCPFCGEEFECDDDGGKQ